MHAYLSLALCDLQAFNSTCPITQRLKISYVLILAPSVAMDVVLQFLDTIVYRGRCLLPRVQN